MCDLVEGDDIGELLLPHGSQTGALLGFRRKKRKSGKVKKSRPTLAESAGNLGNAEAAEREGAAVLLIKMNGGIDPARELLEGIRGTG